MSGVIQKGGFFSENGQDILEGDVTYIPDMKPGTRLHGWISSFTEGSVTLLITLFKLKACSKPDYVTVKREYFQLNRNFDTHNVRTDG